LAWILPHHLSLFILQEIFIFMVLRVETSPHNFTCNLFSSGFKTLCSSGLLRFLPCRGFLKSEFLCFLICFSAALAESASLSPFVHPATQASAPGQRENHEKYSAEVEDARKRLGGLIRP
jgi:hypothetical protein